MDIFEDGKPNEQVHAKVMNNHNKLLLQLTSDMKEVKDALIGNSFTNGRGLVHEIVDIKKDVLDLKQWKMSLELLEETESQEDEKKIKKNNLVWVFVSAICAAASVILVFLGIIHKK